MLMHQFLHDNQRLLEKQLRPREMVMAENGTVAYVVNTPDCDICKHERVHPSTKQNFITENGTPIPPSRAAYDLKLSTGQWAFVCEPHRQKHALYPDKLGVGMGQRLVVRDDSRRPLRSV